MKEILFDIIQILIIIIILTFYLLSYPSSNSECDINSNVVYSLKDYILFSITTFFCVSISKLFLWYYFRNKNILHVINITISYILILFIAVGGIFIAQQTNEKKTCYEFFIDNKNIFSIFISILFLTFINIIFKCIDCKYRQSENDYEEYQRIIRSI
jgi:hypothetical protein